MTACVGGVSLRLYRLQPHDGLFESGTDGFDVTLHAADALCRLSLSAPLRGCNAGDGKLSFR